MERIQMVDLKKQYDNIKKEVDEGIQNVINSTSFINGAAVGEFQKRLERYLNAEYVIPCANGTDALQIALMALGLKQGDEIIVPCFTYVATAEVIALLNLKPVLAEVCPETFNITGEIIEALITPKTKAIVPVHLFGQCANMEDILDIARKYNLFVIEDTAQALGADYHFSDGRIEKAGTMGDIGCTSFFPSKNLGCYGDGGALMTNNKDLACRLKMIANHGQAKKYHHQVIGCNSRLDSIQAAVLSVKLLHLDEYAKARNTVADSYDKQFSQLDWLVTPKRSDYSTHVFHQYTLKLKNHTDRDSLQAHLASKDVPSMIYYPIPLHLQEAFETPQYKLGDFRISENLCKSVISLPIHTEMTKEELEYIIQAVKSFK